ncbi:MraY family glycosyltransferase [Sulfurimonas autotrophica]|uniref:Glycosyl transferase, family 4, conserved region n=1 Tax=Sulfurimonas autotrophica (strain ATCC BAA-671 / DSM 16294 / JCM 11897 / OK10) TaxID=563040 RepID=E0UUN0_SULAO|nr:glycosyltransferase family 4 protein [Sulfurimonas autotrophica]ADN09534.1 Glycosyl transferase, family 4, conserved region [Sulfurimonas autotrophica DSM 16294]
MIYVALFLLSFVLTYFIKNYAIKKSLVAEVNERSSHSAPTPHGGGIAVAVTWFIGISYLFFAHSIDSSFYYALMAGALLAVVSYIDDLYELSAKVRLLTQALVATFGLYFLGGFERLDLFFFTIESPIITNVFAFFMIIWFINLYNFLDGIDGYAGSEAVFLGLAGFILFGGAHFLVLVFAVLGFLVWNWHRAKIFMGDVGSTLLGYTVAIFTIYYANQDAANLWIWLILFGLFWFDATLTLFRRYRNDEKLSQAHRKHAYQRLNQSGWAHDKVVISAMGVNAVLFGLVYFISNVFVAFVLSVVLLYGVVRYVDGKKGF